ncbi:MAG: hypothetical protein JNK04_00945 [Myxococcales bacterium]|nr:hypothetical protein [Myxococcales bacterium]
MPRESGALGERVRVVRASADARDASEDEERRARADAAIARLEPTLARVRIVVAPAVGAIAGLSVTRADELVENEAWGVAVPVDPGRVTIRIEAPGKKPFLRELEVQGDGVVREVRVDALSDAPPETPGGAPIPTANPLAEPIDDPRWGRLGTAGAIIGGVGLTTLTVSLGLALKASSDEDDALANPAFACDRTGCNAAGNEAVENAQYLGDVATATALIGGTLTAAGLTMVIIELAAPVVKQQSIAVTVGPRHLRIMGSF